LAPLNSSHELPNRKKYGEYGGKYTALVPVGYTPVGPPYLAKPVYEVPEV
jgi:hypothetical protein